MKNKSIFIIAIIAVVIAAWGILFYSQYSKNVRLNEIKAEIANNEAVGTYKNILSLYQEVISLDSKNIEWYVKLADAYYAVEQFGNFEKTCNSIISKFPNNPIGYIKLGNYYSIDTRHQKIIELYNNAPDGMRKNNEFLAIYKKSEFQFVFLARSYDDVSQFENDYAVVKATDTVGYVDISAAESIQRKFVKARVFYEDKAAAFDGKEWFFIDKEGDKVLATKDKIEDLFSMSENYAVAKIAGKYGYINDKFVRFKLEFDMATTMFNGVAAVKKSDKWAIIKKDFSYVSDFIYDDIIIDENNVCSRKGVIWAKKNGKYEMLNLSGNQITKEVFDSALVFVDDLAAVKKDGKWGFVDKDGKIVINYTYQNAKSFNLGIAPVCINDKWGYINKANEIVIANDFDDAKTFYNTGITSITIGNYQRIIQLIKYK